VVGLGCNRFGEACDLAESRAIIDVALELGINHFDTADVYNAGESERLLGECLKRRRERAVIATKFAGTRAGRTDGEPRGRAENARHCLEASLQRLQTDYVDLFYYHRPDEVTPTEETIGAMQELVAEGKARQLACSNVGADQLREMADTARATGMGRIVAVQNQYSLLQRDDDAEVLPLARSVGAGYVPYFPLVSGILTGKFRRGEEAPKGSRLGMRSNWMLTDRTFGHVDALSVYARERGHSLHELAMGTLVSTPGISSVIAGARSPEQLRANVDAAGWELSEDDLTDIPRIEGSGMRVLE
jgi:aryl-alcohol dehydrogenase-like predicted oxidoreductase